MTRILAALSVVAACSLAGCGDLGGKAAADKPLPSPHPPSGTPTKADRACREKWVDLHALHGENGNPGGSQRVLKARWDRLYDRTGVFGDRASARDCGAAYSDVKHQWDGVEGLQYHLYPSDMIVQLSSAESGRKHYLGFHDLPDRDDQLPGDLPRQFPILRREAHRAAADLRDVFDEASQVDVEDKRAVAAYLKRVAKAADANEHVRRVRVALHDIGDYELDEE